MNDSTIKHPFNFKNAMWSFLKLSIAVLALAGATACSESPGGGGGIGGSGKIEPVVNSGLLIGQVTDVGNLTIDGTQLSTDQTNIVINGDSGEIEDVRVGMSVTVEVDNSKLSAERIEYQALVAGPVDSMSADGNTLSMLGQSIHLGTDTFLDGLTTEDIFEGEVLEINGFRNENNTITAQYIRPYVTLNNFFLVGQLEDTQNGQTSYSVSGTVIDFSEILENANPQVVSQLVAGATVVVNLETSTPPSETVSASSFALLPERNAEDYETVTITGPVSSVIDNNSFTVRTFTFQVNDETVFLDSVRIPVERIAIENNTMVIVSGLSVGTDTVLATEITVFPTE